MSNARFAAWVAISISASMAVTALCIQASQIYQQSKRLAYSTDAQRIVLMDRNYPVYLRVESYDRETRTLTALVRDNPTGSDIPMRMRLVDKATIVRQDAIVENGIFTGIKASEAASEADLKEGIRAVAHVILEPGDLYINYLRIGDPFPRP